MATNPDPKPKLETDTLSGAPAPGQARPSGKGWEDEEEDGFFKRNRFAIFFVTALVIGGGYGFYAFSKGAKPVKARPAPERSVIMVQLPPPPPPPPPPPRPEPPPPQQEPEQKMVEQAQVTEPEDKPKDEPPKPKDEPPPGPIGTSIRGDGPADGFGLSGGNGSGGNGLGGNGSGGRSGSKYGWYAGQVQSRIADALRQNSRTRKASLRVQARVWADSNGRITRATVSSTGDSALDAALQHEVLTGLQLQEPPPAGMPMPIVLRLNASRPR